MCCGLKAVLTSWGVEQALKQWKPFIKAHGYLVISDLVWLADNPSQEAVDFWQQNYPDMTTSEQRVKQMQQAGFEVIKHFTQSDQSWTNYLAPLQNKIAQLDNQHFTSNAIKDIQNEIHIHEHYLGQYSYQLFVLKKKG